MKRLCMLAMAWAGLTALLGACGGGGEEAGVLAVAFRLDEGSPVMSAYIGDPTEDSFTLPAGRYYIEALDPDDVLLSLGAVDVGEGKAVDLASSLAAAGGVADPEGAESLKTVANFLIDVQLAKHAFLEIVTGGFTETPFDPAVEPDDASVHLLFEMYGDIAAQEDAVLAALSEVEGRIAVSSRVPYVRSSPAFAPDDLDRTEIQVAFFVALLARAQQMGEAAGPPADACEEGACWVIPLEADRFEGYANGRFWIAKSPETLAMFDKWQEYASKLVQDLGLTSEKTSPGQAREELTGKVRTDFEKWAPGFGPPELIDEIVKFFVKEVAQAVPEFPGTPAPGPTQAKPDTSWIEGFVQKVADKLLGEGHSGLEVASCADDLEVCLTNYVEQGLSQESATAVCVWLFDKLIAPTAAAAATSTATAAPATPKATPTATATPELAPTSEATATPAPDIGWIEGYVAEMSDAWLDMGYSGLDVAVYADDLRQCLIQAVQAGASREEAQTELCPFWIFAPVITPTPETEETPTPEPTPTEAPPPEPTETPTPEATPTPAATPTPGQAVTARGSFTNLKSPVGNREMTENSVTLNFNTAGGLVTGNGRWVEHSFDGDCDNVADYGFQGEYSAATGEFSGTVEEGWNDQCSTLGLMVSPYTWRATLSGGEINGTIEGLGLTFRLTVQSP